MKRFACVCFAVAFLSASVIGQQPDWVRNNGTSQQFPDQQFITGFGLCKVTAEFDKAKSLQRAIEVARGYLAQSIRVRIQSQVGSTVTEQNSKITSYFCNATQSVTTLEIQGVDVRTYYDEDSYVAYALATASRDRLWMMYGEREKALRDQIRQHLILGKKFEESDAKTKALNEFLACYPLFHEMEEAQAILLVTRSSAARKFEELEGEVTKEEVMLSQVREAVQRLIQKPVNSIEDLGWNFAYCLKEQVDLKNVNILVAPLTFHDTRMGSPFARFFKQVLEGKLIEVAKWSPVPVSEALKPRTSNTARDPVEASGAQYVIKGTYWKQGGAIKVIASLLQISDGRSVGSFEAVVDEQVLQKSGLSLEPQNFKAAFADQKRFDSAEVVGGGLTLEVWTNKGAEDLLFAKGDTMSVWVRVNTPAHIRFLYHLANGLRVVLEKDYFIDESKVNLAYTSPRWTFTCDAPFGVEHLQVFASTEPFEPIATEKWGDYDVLKEDLGKFLTTQRGMKMVKQGTMRAEARLVVTTMEK